MSIQRRVALIGQGQGPWISTKGLTEPRAKVTGMKEGGRLIVEITNQEPDHFVIVANGIHSLPEAPWMRVRCEGGGRHVICDILTRKAVA